MRELVALFPVFLRIGIYIVSGVLVAGGLPEHIVERVQAELIHPEVIGAATAGLTVLWWRLAARWGWKT